MGPQRTEGKHEMLNRYILPALAIVGMIVHLSGPGFNGGTILMIACAVLIILNLTKDSNTP